jgi:hypothetical protein
MNGKMKKKLFALEDALKLKDEDKTSILENTQNISSFIFNLPLEESKKTHFAIRRD